MNFSNFTSDIQKNNWNVYGVEVYENSVLTHSYGDTEDGIHEIYSATKSVLSVAFGIAYDRGLVKLDESIVEYLPKEKVQRLSEEQRAVWKQISLHRLLTMSVEGLPFRPKGDNWLDFTLFCKIKNPDKKLFKYTNLNSYLIGVALSVVLKCDLGEFIKEEILKPLDINKFEMTYSPEGYFYGASGMKLCVHDLSKIGLLMSNGGVYNGKRIVSEEYVKMATSVQQMNREDGYGFFFWKYRDGFSINGKWKQKCYCLPDQALIVSFLSHIEEESDDLLASMERNILEC
ncbi:MAG: serine hydrolase [Treponema sp.]|nr:serine hydrolase [Treponema sp.]